MANRLGQAKGEWHETIAKPTILEEKGLAVVWARYQFRLDGKLSHCGVDLFNLVETPDGWKIAALADTRQTEGCEIH